jgi:hypothetical protein
MPEMQEIFLTFCCACGTVNASQRKVPADRVTIEQHCPVCQITTTFVPVAIDFRRQKFVTRIL